MYAVRQLLHLIVWVYLLVVFGRLILGSGFDWIDVVAYGVGVGIVSMLDAWVVIPLSTCKERIEK